MLTDISITNDLVRSIILDIFEQLKIINKKSKRDVRLVMIPATLGN